MFRNPQLRSLAAKLDRSPGGLAVPLPDRDPVLGGHPFKTFREWHEFVDALSLNSTVPIKLGERWTRVQSAYLVSWLSPDLLVAADLVSFAALEYAVMDRYGHLATPRPKYNPKKPNAPMRVSFAKALDNIVTGDGLTDATLPFAKKYGGGVVGRLVQTAPTCPTLPDIRNRLAHGEPLEPGLTSGLLELVRDLIDYAYRSWPEP